MASGAHTFAYFFSNIFSQLAYSAKINGFLSKIRGYNPARSLANLGGISAPLGRLRQ